MLQLFLPSILNVSAGLAIGVAAGLPDPPHGELSTRSAELAQANSKIKAVNLARMRAEKINGGLGQYRPAACMFTSTGDACLITVDQRGFLFRFAGGEPGWEQLGKPPTVDTEILISPDASSVQEVIYNGPIRSR